MTAEDEADVESLSVVVVALHLSDRPSASAEHMKLLGLDVCEVPAVDMRYASDSEVISVVDLRASEILYGSCLSASQAGCALSHQVAYRTFLSTTFEWALIVEEDALPNSQELPKSLCELIACLRLDRPVVVSCYSRMNPMTTFSRSQQLTTLELVDSPFTLPGTVAYLINRAAAQVAVWGTAEQRIAHRADWPSWITKVDFKFVRPWLFTHDDHRESTMVVPRRTETARAVLRRYLRLVSGLAYLSLRSYYPEGFRQYLRHVVWLRVARTFLRRASQ